MERCAAVNLFPLKIVTPGGLRFDGQAQSIKVRSIVGDVTILAGHINYVVPLGMGEAAVTLTEEKRYGACIGGMLHVVGGNATLVSTSFEWAEDIDTQRAGASETRARKIMEDPAATDTDRKMAAARLKRALIRQNVVSRRSK